MEPSSKFPKKLRIIYRDPYATDSSTDEGEEMIKTKNQILGIKRFVKEISCSAVPFGSSEDNGERLGKSCTMSKGVRRRSRGKFASEIRDPFKKKHLWLGTYCTEEEAATVHETKKHEFMMSAEENKNSSAVSLNSDKLYSQPSSSVLLDVSVKAIELEANNEKTKKDQYVVKKLVQESKATVKEEVPIKDLWKDEASIIMLWEPPSASDSWEELFRQCGLGNHMPNRRHHLLLNHDNGVDHLPENAKLIDLPDMKIDNEDMAWEDEILTWEKK